MNDPARKPDADDLNRLLAETIPHIVWMADPNGDACYLNQRGIDELGLPPEAIYGSGWLGLVHPDDATRAGNDWRQAAQSGNPYRTEFRLRLAHGGYHWYIAQGLPRRNDAGRIEKWVGTLTDIDDRKQMEAERDRAINQLRLQIERMPMGYVLLDSDFRIIDWNSAAEQIFGYRRDEVLGMGPPFEKILASPVLQQLEGHRARIRAGDMAAHAVNDNLTRDGRTITCAWYNTPLIDDDGQFLGAIALAMDITASKRAEAELNRTAGLLRAVADGTPDAVFVKDHEGRYLLVNPAAARFVGKPVEEIVGKDDTAIFGSEDALFIMNRDRRVLATGQAETEEEVLTAAGVTRTYLATKAPYRDGQGNIIGVIGISRDITAQKEAEAALRLRDRAIQAVTQGILITDPNLPDNPIIYASPSFQRLTGYSTEEVVGRNCRFLQGKDTDPSAVRRVREAIEAGRPCTVEVLNYRKDGSTFWNELSLAPVTDDTGRLVNFVGVQTDVTQRRSLEEQYRHSQKMEAIGRLAGGVAHDFNNLLTIIIGCTEVLHDSALGHDATSRSLLGEIHKAADRSAALTRQLLAFSRKQVIAPRILNLNDVIRDTEKMLGRVIGEDIQLITALHPRLRSIKADAGQIEQVLLNLAVNARDAMPRGGRLTIETRNMDLDPVFIAARGGVHPGPYVVLVVSDTGVGMSAEVQQRLFEPFFTTKDPGRGTGLGLAAVHGVVKQAEGIIEIDSEPDKGALFRIFLPSIDESDAGVRSQSGVRSAPRGTETILLVEDEPGLRNVTRHVLQQAGYTVLEATDGNDALRVAAGHPKPIQLLVTDVVMPGMGGRALAEHLLKMQPKLKVLYVSGYTNDQVVRQGILYEQMNYLQKPFSIVVLAQRIRQVLDA